MCSCDILDDPVCKAHPRGVDDERIEFPQVSKLACGITSDDGELLHNGSDMRPDSNGTRYRD